MSLHKILVIGCGSIGARHIRTLLATGRTRVVACDNRPDIGRQMKETYQVDVAENWQTALEDPTITGVVIATPAPLHVPMSIRTLELGRHLLIEKPLALELTGLDRLVAARDRAGKFVGVAYVMHFVPGLQAARQTILSGAVGAVKHVIVSTGQHFPTFRPAYREIYYRDHAQGGGAIQDALTHTANSVEWIVGPTTRLYCDASHQVLEGVQVEDTVNVSARNAGVLVNYGMNQFQAPNETRWDFHGEKGTVRVELHGQRWGVLRHGETDWTWTPAPIENRDTLFCAQAHAFLDGCENKPQLLCTLEEGMQTLRFNVAALQSWRTGLPVEP